MNSNNNKNRSNFEGNFSFNTPETILLFLYIGVGVFFFVYSALEKDNNSENSITYLKQDFYEIYNQSNNEDIKVNNEEVKNEIYSLYKTKLKYMPQMEYGQYVKKIESGDFVSQQNIYNPVEQTVVKVFSDQYGQQYAISSIKNNENNANISPYYENITSLNPIEKLDKTNNKKEDKSDNVYSLWYQHNKKGIKQFLGDKEVLTQVEKFDCQCNKDKDLENISKFEFARDIENFVNEQYLEKLNHLPDLQYVQYVKKLKSGDFEFYQKAYDFNKNRDKIILTDQHGQQYDVLMISNNENNALLSKHYEDIKVLKPISNQSGFGKKDNWITKNIDWFKNNKEALRSFMDENS